MNLFAFDFQGRHFAVVLDLDLQLERVLVDGIVLAVKPLGQGVSHQVVELQDLGQVKLEYAVNPKEQCVNYQVWLNSDDVVNGVAPLSDEAKALVVIEGPDAQVQVVGRAKEKSWVVLGSIGLKLAKSFKVIKVALVGASLAVYSVMFTFEFALALVAVFIVHEYGHVRAMKKFGIPTKGFYLIPFMGGLALGEKARTQWEDLYISMMGPVYGLFMTAIFYVTFLITGSHFCGLVASVSAFLNLVNLFPVYPLDGGHVIKALVFSRRNTVALWLFLIVSAITLFLVWQIGMYFMCFFIFIGVVDLISSWSIPLSADKTPLTSYGIWFSLLWYFGVALLFIAMILLLASAQVPGSEMVVKILNS